ncbi:MAG: DNA repair protein RadA/Sms [Sphingobacteriales bacterium]|jgi:DNA repair protein RadA/Sms
MAKTKSAFFCQNCGNQSAKWVGQCKSCNEWNTMVEEVLEKETKNAMPIKAGAHTKPQPKLLQDVETSSTFRIPVPDEELSRTLGGGIVPGSLVLLGGEPGIGKSTLLLQLAVRLKETKVLYISGEESAQQIKMRAERLSVDGNQCYVYTETNTQHIFKELEKVEPQLVVIDSIQTLHSGYVESAPGSVSQIRQCAAELMKYAKLTNTPVFIIGHINKDGAIAGPKLLEHMVDTVLQFEGERHYDYRILRSIKNRFGSTAELGIYQMQGNGLREVSNPSEILISSNSEIHSGIAISVTLEGQRPLLIESQALVSTAVYGTPQRVSTGFDTKRLNMLLAVLEKRYGFPLGGKDVFINITGGLRIEDPAIDLGMMCAIISSSEDIIIPKEVCFAGEVGLGGEIRMINRLPDRIKEAEKLGYKKIFVPQSKDNIKDNFKIKVLEFGNIQQVLEELFG